MIKSLSLPSPNLKKFKVFDLDLNKKKKAVLISTAYSNLNIKGSVSDLEIKIFKYYVFSLL
ncbi:hypothetical protein BpHYR1_040351 [Brachionus plicatilis]|uniref:Uncharacterized protein n=1 Tax=Brachionus plicatilis TaxID=10195 RepID=A0A3M7PWP0_BRAPC|nr:hypothetical protein BpHYR1_040351 [Brachionus plicatilis]